MATTVLLWILAAALVLTGLVGLVLPALPGAVLIFCGLLLGAWIEDFAHIGQGTLIVLALLALATFVVDFAAGALGARRYGASKRAVAGAAIGALVGIFFGFVGVLIGPFVGAVIGELSGLRSTVASAGRAGVGATVGFIVGTAAKFAIGVAMVGLFAAVRLF